MILHVFVTNHIDTILLLAGTNVDAAKKILEDSGLPIIQAKDLDHAAVTAVDQASLKTKAQAC